MKKVLLSLLVIVLVLGSVFYYSYHKKVSKLKIFEQGGRYATLGVELQIPSSSKGVRGFLSPYISFGEKPVVLKILNFPPTSLQGGKLVLQGDEVTLLISELKEGVSGGKVKNLSVGLTDKYALSSFQVELLETQDLKIENLKLDLDSEEGGKKKWNFSFKDLAFQPRDKKEEQIKFKALSLGLQSVLQKEKIFWELFASVGEGNFKTKRAEVQIQKGGFKIGGELRELSGESLLDFLKPFQKIPHISNPETKDILTYFALFGQLLRKVEFNISRGDFTWEGMRVLDSKDHKELFVLKPLQGLTMLSYNEQIKGMEYDSHQKIQSLEFHFDKTDFKLSDLSLSAKGSYPNRSYLDLLDGFFKYISRVYSGTLQNSPDPMPLIISYLNQYPEKLEFELKTSDFVFRSPEIQIKQKDFLIAYRVKKDGFEYQLATDDFGLQLEQGPLKEIKDLKTDFRIGLLAPWKEVLTFAQSQKGETLPSLSSFIDLLVHGKYGVYLDWLVNGGSLNYHLDLKAKVEADYKNISVGQSTLASLINPLTIEKGLKEMLFLALDQLEVSLKLEIKQLSHFQKFLDTIKPGSSLMLAVIAPYVQIDTAQDILKINFQYQKGKVTLNGQTNDVIEKLIEGVKHNTQ